MNKSKNRLILDWLKDALGDEKYKTFILLFGTWNCSIPKQEQIDKEKRNEAIVKAFYQEKKSRKEIAAEYNLSESQISVIIAQYVNKK